jgi:hypothetical protein
LVVSLIADIFSWNITRVIRLKEWRKGVVMIRACDTQGGEEKCTEIFGGEARRNN